MSERWGICPRCEGYQDECYLCGGTGFDGSIDALLNPSRTELSVKTPRKTFNYEEIMEIVIRKIHERRN